MEVLVSSIYTVQAYRWQHKPKNMASVMKALEIIIYINAQKGLLDTFSGGNAADNKHVQHHHVPVRGIACLRNHSAANHQRWSIQAIDHRGYYTSRMGPLKERGATTGPFVC
jgi:hypothetical protein